MVLRLRCDVKRVSAFDENGAGPIAVRLVIHVGLAALYVQNPAVSLEAAQDEKHSE